MYTPNIEAILEDHLNQHVIVVSTLKSGESFEGTLRRRNKNHYEARIEVDERIQILNLPLKIIDVISTKPLVIKLRNNPKELYSRV